MFEFGMPMKEAIDGIFQQRIDQLKLPFALKYEISSDLKPKDYGDILNFYKSIKKDPEFVSEKEVRILSGKETELTLSSSQYYLKKGNIIERIDALRDLNRCRINLEKEIENNPEDDQSFKIKTSFTIQTVKSMGDFLDLQSSFELARKCYHSINFIPKALEMYQKQVNNENDPSMKRKNLVNMGKYAFQVGRQDIGLQKLQQAYCLSYQIDELAEVSEYIVDFTTEKIENNANTYLRQMMDKKFYTPLAEEDQIRIEKIAEDNDSLGWGVSAARSKQF